jgi:glycine cleavage system H lipoate-binding protein
MNLPENLKYTKDHEWILVEGGIGRLKSPPRAG